MIKNENERVFHFKTVGPDGPLKVRVLDSYNTRVYNMQLDKWRDENPRPEVPSFVDEVPWKNEEGKRQIVSYDDKDVGYLQALNAWINRLSDYATDVTHTYIDQTSFDPGILEFALETTGIENPVEAYLLTVAKPKEPDTEAPDPTEPAKKVVKKGFDELQEFYRWMQEIGTTSEALVERYFADFRSKDNKQAGRDETVVRVADTAGSVGTEAAQEPANASDDGDASGG